MKQIVNAKNFLQFLDSFNQEVQNESGWLPPTSLPFDG